jgi:hypothetical protein
MEFLCIGLSYKSAPISVRERLALSEERQLEMLQALQQTGAEAFLVSTCNRVEYYVVGQGLDPLRQKTRGVISSVAGAEALEHLRTSWRARTGWPAGSSPAPVRRRSPARSGCGPRPGLAERRSPWRPRR